MSVAADLVERTLSSILKNRTVKQGPKRRILNAASAYLNRIDARLDDPEELTKALGRIEDIARRAVDAEMAGKGEEARLILREFGEFKKPKGPVKPKDKAQRKMTQKVTTRKMTADDLSDEVVDRLGKQFDEDVQDAAFDTKLSGPERRSMMEGEEMARQLTAKKFGTKSEPAAPKAEKKAKPKAEKKAEPKAAETPRQARSTANKKAAAAQNKAEKIESKRNASDKKMDKEAKRAANREAWYEKNADSYDETRKRMGKPPMTADERKAYIAKIAKQAEEARKRKGK